MAQPLHDAQSPVESSVPWRRLAAALVVILVFSGIVFRVVEFANNRSLWLDEAALAQNILHLPLRDLALGRLTDDQVAPPGFLLAVKAITLVAGSGEQRLRLLPFAAGLAALGLFGWLAWRRLGPVGAVAATALMAWSWPLIYYSNELKQYSTDAFVALLIFVLAEKMTEQTLTTHRAWRIGLAGVGALLFSHPAVFVLGAWGIQKKIECARQGRGDESRRWNILGAAWVLTAGAVVAANYTAALGNARLAAYHAEAFLHVWPWAAVVQSWEDGLAGTWALATTDSSGWWWLALLLVGVWLGWQKHRRETVFIITAVLLTALASLLHLYPWTLRLLLFLLPALFWLVGRGADGLGRLGRGKAVLSVSAAIVLAGWSLLREAVSEARAPIAREHLRPVVAELARQARAGDVVLVFDYTRYAFDYYWPRMAHTEVAVSDVIFEKDKLPTPAQMAAKIAPALQGHPPRVWLVATHYELGAGQDNLRGLVAALRQQYPGAADFVPPGGTAQGVVFYRPGFEPPAP